MWKGMLFVIVSAAIIITGLYSLTHVPYAEQIQKEAMPMEISYDQRIKKENTGVPSYIQIPTLQVYADLEEVKVSDQGKLNYPLNQAAGGWLSNEKQQRLGQKGVVILAGQFDRQDGKPDFFYNLSSLEKGDVIDVTDLNGKEYEYEVSDKGEKVL